MAHPQPNIIPHPADDHRHVEASELLSLKFCNNYLFRPFSDIIDYVVWPDFLKPTSKWTEAHLTAFRCLRLENLPGSRIVPLSEIPDDKDPRMQLVIEHLLASEDDIRSGKAELALCPATTFYTQLQVVLRRHTTCGSLESQRSLGTSSSFEEDRAEDVLNEAGVAFLELLCSFHWSASKDSQTRIRFSRGSMQPALVVHGEVVQSYNDGRFYVERRSARRPNDWVSQDSYPRASLECKRKRHTRKELLQAQELGELLAIGYNRYVNNKWDEKNREVYLIGIHHNKLYITTAEFPRAYFQWVQDDQIPWQECLVMRQSSSFDLGKPESRKEACRLIFTVLQRIMK